MCTLNSCPLFTTQQTVLHVCLSGHATVLQLESCSGCINHRYLSLPAPFSGCQLSVCGAEHEVLLRD